MPEPASVNSGSSRPLSSPRISKKLVIKGHASSSGASYTLFLKVQLPVCEQEETYALLARSEVELQAAVVHRLDASGAAPALSTSAATAASSLGIPLSIDHELNDSFIDFDPAKKRQHRSSVGSSDHSHLPTVVRTDDGQIVLRTFVRPSPSSRHVVAPQTASTSYMVTLHLFVAPTSNPPLAPYSVRLLVPFCLNNFMHFTVDESLGGEPGLEGMTVEVDPPILPVSAHRRSPKRRPSAGSSHHAPSVASLSDDEADVTLLGSAEVEDSNLEHDDTAIVGPFQACEALVIRIASQQASDLVLPGPPSRVLPNALRANKALSSIVYQSQTSRVLASEAQASSNVLGSATNISFQATLRLEDPFFPGLDREVLLYIQFDPKPCVIEWQPVAVDASRGILSWSFSPTMSTCSSPSQQARTSADGLLSKSSTFEISDLVVLPEPSQQGADDEDLLSVAPPKGIDDADFDFSLDNGAEPTIKQRRFSLQSSGSSKPYPSQPPSEPSEPNGPPSKLLMVAFNLLPILQSEEPITITVRGTLMLSESSFEAFKRQDVNLLPGGLGVPGALTHEYARPTIAPIEERLPRAQPTDQQRESLEDSRETVQQLQEKPELSTRGLNPIDDLKTEEILRQALAIITAHNESLSDPNHRLMLSTDQVHRFRREEERERSDWMLHTSHLLWTLFLTAMILLLFNAGQNANRVLSTKLDELSRIVEASAAANANAFSPPSEDADVVSGILPVISPTASTVPTQQVGEVLQSDNPPDILAPQPDDTALELGHPARPSHSWPNSVHTDNTEEQLHIPEAGVTYFVSNWLQDLLRVPVLLIQHFWSILTGA